MSTYVFLDENNKLTHSTNTTLNAPNIEISQGSITSDHGTINFNDEHLTTTGNITGNSLVIDANGGISSSDLINLNSITKLNYVNSTLGGVLKLIKGSGGQSNNYDYEILNDYVATNHNNTASAGFRIRSLAPTIDKAFFGHNVTYGNCCILNPDNNTNFVFKQNSLHISNSTNSTLSFNYDSGDFAHNIADTKKHIFQINNTDILTINQTGYHLDVTGNINFTGNITKDGDALISSLWTEDSNNIYYNNGNVGIGTNIPTQKLDVTGTTKTTVLDVDSKLKIDYSNNHVNFKLGTYTTPFFAAENNGTTLQFKLNDPGTASGYYTSFHVSSSSGDPDFKIAGDKISMNNDLDVTGNINFTGNITKDGDPLVSSVWTTSNSNIYYNSGSVGIGNSAPSYTLDVSGNIYGQNLYTMYNIYSTNGALALRSASGSGMNFYTNNLGTARMSIDTDGYVGINTSPSSSYQLDVNGGIRGSSVRTYHYYYSDSNMYFKPNSGYNMYFETNNSTRMTIDTNGYVGIGTPPSYKFHVSGDSYLSGTTYLYGTVYRSGGWQTAMWKKSSSNAYWDEGNVGIGTTPSYKLDVNGISRHKGKVIISNDSSSECTCQFDSTNQRISTWANTMWFVMQGSNRMVINSSGNVGINTTSPQANLHVVGGYYDNPPSSRYVYYNGSSIQEGTYDYGSNPIAIKYNGFMWGYDYARFIQSSDSRIKTNIVDVPDNLALQQLRNIPCRYYEYIDKIKRGTDKTIGFIAQEVKSVIPMAVSQQIAIIPNVYKIINCTWTSNGDKFIMSSSDLSDVSGVKYKFIVSNVSDGSDEKEIEIKGNSDNTFTFDTQYISVFCYGSEVNDFHTLDKHTLFTLNFSATQEIDRIQQTHITEIETLKTENTELKQENMQQQTEINTLKTELDNIKELLLKNNII